jgi:hypothetical protein
VCFGQDKRLGPRVWVALESFILCPSQTFTFVDVLESQKNLASTGWMAM